MSTEDQREALRQRVRAEVEGFARGLVRSAVQRAAAQAAEPAPEPAPEPEPPAAMPIHCLGPRPVDLLLDYLQLRKFVNPIEPVFAVLAAGDQSTLCRQQGWKYGTIGAGDQTVAVVTAANFSPQVAAKLAWMLRAVAIGHLHAVSNPTPHSGGVIHAEAVSVLGDRSARVVAYGLPQFGGPIASVQDASSEHGQCVDLKPILDRAWQLIAGSAPSEEQ